MKGNQTMKGNFNHVDIAPDKIYDNDYLQDGPVPTSNFASKTPLFY